MDIKFQIPDARDFLTAILGIIVVMAALALIAVCIILISKIIRIVESRFTKKAAPEAPETPAPVPAPEGLQNGEVDLVGVDEKTAAVIMAIVSQQSNIPLNRLSFKSIRLIDDGKGGEAK